MAIAATYFNVWEYLATSKFFLEVEGLNNQHQIYYFKGYFFNSII
jgi:hypothetical protein